jgi:uncharacterized phosphosugar-binding protein
MKMIDYWHNSIQNFCNAVHSSDYWISLTETMNQIMAHETNAIGSAAQLCADAIAQGGVIHVFGTGHSSHQAADTFYRAGGLACVNAILEPFLSIGGSALLSTWMERQSGLASLILDRYDLKAGEPMIVFSVSGVNSVPVEVAAESRSRGLPVIAITSQSYCGAVAEARGLARTLITEADLVIDNHVPIGDAVVPIPHSNFRAASTSTIAASLIYHLLLEQILKHLTQRNVCIPIFASSNLPSAHAHNAELIARYRKRVRNF